MPKMPQVVLAFGSPAKHKAKPKEEAESPEAEDGVMMAEMLLEALKEDDAQAVWEAFQALNAACRYD